MKGGCHMFGFKRRGPITPDPRDPGEARTLHQFKCPIKRGRLASWWEGHAAVRAKVPLQDYLGCRRYDYQGLAPQSRHPWPFEVRLENGEVHRVPNPEAEKHPWQRILEEPAGEDSFEDAMVRPLRFRSWSEGQAIFKELGRHEEEFSRLTARLMEVNENLEDMAVERRREIAEGRSPVPATQSRPPRRRGRPCFPASWALWVVATHLAIAAMISVEAFQFAVPYLNAIGVDLSNLAAEWKRNPIGILMGSGFALATSVGIFILWYWTFQSIRSIFRDAGPEPRWKTAIKVALPLVLVALLIAVAWGIGKMRGEASESAGDFLGTLHNQATAASGSDGVFLLLTLLVPLAAAYLQHKVGGILARRQKKIAEEQRQWDQAEHQALLVRERRAELIRLLEEEREHIERRREEARDKVRALAEHAQAAERLIRERIEAERRYTVAYANGLVAALERDRYYFLKAARKAGATPLVNGPSQDSALSPRESLQGLLPGLNRVQGGNGRFYGSNSYPPVS